MKRAALLFALAASAVAAPSCATLGSEGRGDVDLPSTGVGPFRKLDAKELLGVAPFVLDDPRMQLREPAVVALDDDPASSRVALFATALEGNGKGDAARHEVIVRSRADDARSFYGTALDVGHTPPVVLRADQPWEGAGVRSPSVLRVGATLFLAYAADGGIGVASSSDGLTFTKLPGPVLARDPASPWERSEVGAPSLAFLTQEAEFRMLYASGDSIGEARSADLAHWTRVSAAPILVPSAAADPATLAPGEHGPFDTAKVTDPCLLPRITPAGREHVRVLYTGVAADGSSAILFAARYGAEGALEKQPAPVYSVGKHEAAPALFAWGGGAMLYVHQDRDGSANVIYPAVVAAFAPATESLAPPVAYADGP